MSSYQQEPETTIDVQERGIDIKPPSTKERTSREQVYLIQICRALMMFGAPTHRLEMFMKLSADAVGLPLQSFYLPGCMFLSFNDTLQASQGVQIVRCTPSLNLSKLRDAHFVYKDVIHKGVGVDDATAQVRDIIERKEKFPRWARILSYGLASAFIGPVSYGARPIDLPIIFIIGSMIGFLELILAPKSELYGYVFEISVAILASFVGRGFGSIPFNSNPGFCFSAISQASIVLILPGFTITTSALELQSKYIVTGSVRMVYGIIYTLFLAFGFTVGITIYGAIDSSATSSTSCQPSSPFWWQVIFVIPFTICYIIVNQAKWKQMPVMIIVTLAGWLVNHFTANAFSQVPSISQALGALTVGVMANLCSRFGLGLAVAIMHPAIFIQVPGSFAASGSLINGVKSADALTNHIRDAKISEILTRAASYAPTSPAVLNAGYAMIEIAIGITVGLSVSALLVYPFRRRKGNSGLFAL